MSKRTWPTVVICTALLAICAIALAMANIFFYCETQ